MNNAGQQVLKLKTELESLKNNLCQQYLTCPICKPIFEERKKELHLSYVEKSKQEKTINKNDLIEKQNIWKKETDNDKKLKEKELKLKKNLNGKTN
ncbi:hypothetical protein RFI_34709 [Reticulomyxa filosa]|uniref:Uncharacterized protein n=1 Tax=Reticulomyxa filosa TaxID=46433 RepID=X6LNG9_RETFI|nr:hypothetical protein RFI_34709 [Reticulomyxa filosa]|eukprot:ETO02702.1 hypothetical protein RFI_34709 [Reticulomyxa filosa]